MSCMMRRVARCISASSSVCAGASSSARGGGAGAGAAAAAGHELAKPRPAPTTTADAERLPGELPAGRVESNAWGWSGAASAASGAAGAAAANAASGAPETAAAVPAVDGGASPAQFDLPRGEITPSACTHQAPKTTRRPPRRPQRAPWWRSPKTCSTPWCWSTLWGAAPPWSTVWFAWEVMWCCSSFPQCWSVISCSCPLCWSST
mmetsp:Transcript_120192/g.326164  ORF Transcript_120192/g.326164 Transcript_120192/m.326164 type:complete len:206 (-) Transcript_120192:501-1118(-)